MLLHESFGMSAEAELIRAAVAAVWSRGIRTEDLAESGCRIVGTREMASYIAEAVAQRAAAGQLA
jgi:3-isopropylmalate dehydrogenase